MPSWHDDARRMRDSGMTASQIVKHLSGAGINVSETRVYQVTGPMWEKYLARDRMSKKQRDREPQEMPDRTFEKITSPDPSDVYHRARIKCSHDGCKESLIFSRRGPINPAQAAKWFRDKGWGVGGGPRADLCPTHLNGLAQTPAHSADAVQVAVHENINAHPAPDMRTTAPAPPPFNEVFQKTDPVEEPKQMTRMDRRVIIAKLNDLYVDEATGYRDDWNDAMVAKDLGAPIEWVREIRDENFGPHRNERYVAIETVVMGVMGEIAQVTALIKDYDDRAERLDVRLDAFEKTLAEAKALMLEWRKR